MTKLSQLLDEYEKDHKHPTNIKIHWIAEPLAIFALLALASSVRLPIGSLLWPFLTILLIYFAYLSIRVMLSFLPIVALFIVMINAIDNMLGIPIWQWASPLFAICWLALLLGHKIEGGTPSVFQNPHLIFVGPAWLMRIIFRRLNLRDH